MKLKRLWMLALLAALLLLLTSCGGFKFEGRTLNPGKVGVEYSDTVAVEKGNLSYELDYTDNLPMGLVLAEDGRITGVPEEYGTFVFTLIAIDEKENFKEAGPV